MALVSAKCTNCGGDIQLDDSKKTGFCLHCGSKVNVEEAVKTVKIDKTENIEKYLKLARNASESGNNEETEKYCNMILEIDNKNAEVWFLKGKAVGWMTTLANNRLAEMVTAFTSGIECIDANDHETLANYSDSICAEIVSISKAIIDLVCNNFSENPCQSNVDDYANQITLAMNTLFPLGIILSENIETPFDIDLLNGYAAAMGYSAVVAAWGMILKDFGPSKEDQYKYAWERFVEQSDYCLRLLQCALVLTNDAEVANQIVQKYIVINNIVKDSCSYTLQFNDFGSYYAVDYKLTDNAKTLRLKNNNEMNQKLTEKLVEIKEKEVSKKRKFYEEHPEKLKEEIKENKAIIKECEEKIAENNTKISEFDSKIESLEKEKESLGLFKFSAKSELKEKINLEEYEKKKLVDENTELNTQLLKSKEFLELYSNNSNKKKEGEE